jgi:exopolysaccharide production protein ExoQ
MLGGVAAREVSNSIQKQYNFSLFYIVSILVLVSTYWVIDHKWESSVLGTALDEFAYTGSENSTADRMSQVNADSTVSRLLLAGWGVICLIAARGSKPRWSSSFLIISIALATLIASSVMWSVSPRHSLIKLAVLGCVVITALGFAASFSLRQLIEMICIVCVCFVGIGIIAEVAQGTFRPWRPEYRFIGTCHPNSLAIYAAILCMSARVFLQKGRPRTIAIALVSIGVLVILLAKSRSTLGAVLAAMLVTQIVAVRGSNRLILILGGLLVAGAGAIGSTFINQQTMGQLGNAAAMGRTESVTSLTGRLPLWEEMMTSIQKRPFFGFGYLGYWDANRVDYLSDVFKWEIPHGHNVYLDVCLDIGIVGLFVYILWLLVALASCVRTYNKSSKIEYAATFGLVVFAMVNGIGESLFKLPTFAMFTMLCFLCSMIWQRSSGEQNDRDC